MVDTSLGMNLPRMHCGAVFLLPSDMEMFSLLSEQAD